ncbi:hypothetical protein [Salinisphaera aquimarina]|uniref:Uncharacterized protein n=1 Tax=Salinisphaera aquimarina TaxID=2094031 RepID=A0ABV7EU57_9GAMM
MTAADANTAYADLLLRLCTGLAAQAYEVTETETALRCPACGQDHMRSAEAVIAFAMAHRLTGDAAWAGHARRLAAWAINRQQRNGAWVESEHDPWAGIGIFILLALAAAHELLVDELPPEENRRWLAAIERGAAWTQSVRTSSHIGQASRAIGRRLRIPGCRRQAQFWNSNYLASLPLALNLCGHALGRDFHALEETFLAQVLKRFNTEGLLTGEVNEPAPRWAKLFRRNDTIDPGYNLDMSLGVLGLYARRVADHSLLERVARSATTHLCLLYPDGSIDNGMGARGYKAAYYGSQTAHGLQMMTAALASVDACFNRAGMRNAQLLTRSLRGDLLTRGPFEARTEAPCLYPTFARAASLALALMVEPGPHGAADTPLPCETPHGDWTLASLNTQILRRGPLMLGVSGQAGDSSHLPYRFITPATGGTLTRLHHDDFGIVQAAGHVVYQRVEPSHMPARANEVALGAQILSSDRRLSSAHERRVRLTRSREGRIHAAGRLRARQTWRTGARYELEYRLHHEGLDKNIRVHGGRGEQTVLIREPLIITPDTSLSWPDSHTLLLQRQDTTLRIGVRPRAGACSVMLDAPVTHYAPPLTSQALAIELSGRGRLELWLSFSFERT